MIVDVQSFLNFHVDGDHCPSHLLFYFLWNAFPWKNYFHFLFTYVTRLEESATAAICFAIARQNNIYETIRTTSSEAYTYLHAAKYSFYFVNFQVL